MEENPYQSPLEIQIVTAPRGDALRWPAIGCIGSALVGVFFALYQFAFYLRVIEIAQQSDNPKAMGAANELVYGSYLWAGLSILAIAAAICMFTRRGRWFVLVTSLVGVGMCIPAPLAVVVLIRIWRKDVWDSFQ